MYRASVLFFIIIFYFGCKNKPDKEELRAEIIKLHQNLIDAHLNKNPQYFKQDLSDQFISVKNGEINYPSPNEIITNISDYINNTDFTEYRDLRDPIIGFSDDGSLAWAVVQIKVKGERKLEDSSFRNIDFVCAWLTIYQRSGDRWKTLAEVSTFK